jgi:hypothetical protein
MSFSALEEAPADVAVATLNIRGIVHEYSTGACGEEFQSISRVVYLPLEATLHCSLIGSGISPKQH